jgi:hypothetical protein
MLRRQRSIVALLSGSGSSSATVNSPEKDDAVPPLPAKTSVYSAPAKTVNGHGANGVGGHANDASASPVKGLVRRVSNMFRSSGNGKNGASCFVFISVLAPSFLRLRICSLSFCFQSSYHLCFRSHSYFLHTRRSMTCVGILLRHYLPASHLPSPPLLHDVHFRAHWLLPIFAHRSLRAFYCLSIARRTSTTPLHTTLVFHHPSHLLLIPTPPNLEPILTIPNHRHPRPLALPRPRRRLHTGHPHHRRSARESHNLGRRGQTREAAEHKAY